MLKPDPRRYSRAVITRIGGPDWIEPDPSEAELAELSDVLAFHPKEELPADLALDLRLHELLDLTLEGTAATGAVIALASGDKMVCRATLGEKAPKTGVFVNTRSGLSGLCVQTRELQRCEDALTDPRVNTDACRALDIRSIVVLPIMDGKKLWGILEIFSTHPQAFNDADVRTLQALGCKVADTVHEAVEGGTLLPASDKWFDRPRQDLEHSDTSIQEINLEEAPAPVVAAPPASKPVPRRVRRHDYRTTALTVAVIALAALLGWMVGRVGRSIAANQSGTQLPASSEATQTPVLGTPSAVVEYPAAPSQRVSPERTQTTPPTPKPKIDGGLVVYEQGKVVFRAKAPVRKSSPLPAGTDPAAMRTEVTPDDTSADETALGTPHANDGYLLKRVEPVYPEEAREKHIQGAVVLNALVGTDGAVQELKLMSGDPLLVNAATDAVRQWRFQPHRVQGRPVEFETRITVNFALPHQSPAS